MGALAAAALASSGAAAFPHVVREGETLAQIAERTYGRVQMEQVLVAANALDAGAGVPIMPGLRLEIPALGHHRVTAGETWANLAERLLGAADRSDVLALSNDTMPWIEPTDGQEIIVPYNLRYVVGQHDTLLTIAYRFLGKRDKAWMLDKYNHLKQDPLRRGMVILVPLTDLPLTTQGKAEAASAGALVRSEGAGRAREAQRRVDAELPQLASDVRSGRYIDAVARANRLLGYGDLARVQIATVHRQLLEAYVALDATGLAETACAAWRDADPTARLDPIELSPKIVRACTSSVDLHLLRTPPPDPAPPTPADAGSAR
ncbi:LysM peptidoglycan-binding domain-containing protein [Sorangium sp. So ce131]|uniref:LysM peptidoglycan-binding domain-containing protein n=1 Tax=Sorangium sp. So ce131 TaxID=3133282 RepID=UPI003F60FF70